MDVDCIDPMVLLCNSHKSPLFVQIFVQNEGETRIFFVQVVGCWGNQFPLPFSQGITGEFVLFCRHVFPILASHFRLDKF